MTQSEIAWKARRVIAELPFIPAASNWLKLLLSLLAEPLMFVSSLYIVAETVIPGAANWSAVLTNGTNTVMSLAPEIVLPGCFQQAQFAMNHGNKVRGYLLYGLCALFGLLTIVTLASFVWHFTAIVGATLLFIRCGSGISYTIILNIAGPEDAPVAARLHVDNTRIETLAETVEVLASTVDEISQDVLQLLDRVATSQNNEPLALPEPAMYTPQAATVSGVRITAKSAGMAAYSIDALSQTTDDEENEESYEVAQEAPRPECIQYPDVPGFSVDKVRRVIDARLAGTSWRNIPGNYSRDIKPIKEAWEALNVCAPHDTDEHPALHVDSAGK